MFMQLAYLHWGEISQVINIFGGRVRSAAGPIKVKSRVGC